MASFNTVTVSGSAWIDLNTASGCPVGTEVQLQNIGPTAVLVQESTLAPVNENGAVLFDPSYGELSKAVSAAGSLKLWAKSMNPTSPTKIAIFE